MGKLGHVMQGLKPVIMMVMVQVALAGVNIFYKLAENAGLSLRVLIAYRFMFAAATVIPIALILEWKKKPKLTWKVLLLAFFCGLFGGSMAQNLFAEALVLTSATFAAAMTNIIPAATFILAIIFRMERLGCKTWAGKAKIMGTCLCIGGAMLLTFYQGSQVKFWSTHFDLLHESQELPHRHSRKNSNILGFFLAILCCISTSLALILQAKMGRIYPYSYSSTALISLMGSLQATAYALCTKREWSQWRLGWNIKLLAAAYMGIIASGVMWAFMMFCVRIRGPLFVSVFNPLMLVLVALFSSLLLDEKLYLGSVLGAVIIIMGLYTVLWGKSREMKKMNRLVPPSKSFTEGNEVEHDNNDYDYDCARQDLKGLSEVAAAGHAVMPNFVPLPQPHHEIIEEEDDIQNPHS